MATTYIEAVRREERLTLLVEIAAAEGRLGLLTDTAKMAFYGLDYPTPEERLDKLIKAEARMARTCPNCKRIMSEFHGANSVVLRCAQCGFEKEL